MSGISSLFGSILGGNAVNTGIENAQNDLNPNQLNINQLNTQATGIAQQNAASSIALQNQYTPWVTSGQSASNYGLQSQLTSPTLNNVQSTLLQGYGQPLNSSLLNSAVGTAQSQLNLGGSLDQGTQNAVTRSALSTAGGVTPGGGLGLGRDITAADLGQTSQQLMQQRLVNAGNLGQAQLGASQASSQNTQNIGSLVNTINSGLYGRTLSASGMYNGIQSPTTGLNPGQVASLAQGNQGQQSLYNTDIANLQLAQGSNNANTLGQIFGSAQGSNGGAAGGILSMIMDLI